MRKASIGCIGMSRIQKQIAKLVMFWATTAMLAFLELDPFASTVNTCFLLTSVNVDVGKR